MSATAPTLADAHKANASISAPTAPSRADSKSLSPPPPEPSEPPPSSARDGSSGDPNIDPELASLPPPPHPNGDSSRMTITESIASAPPPRQADFSMSALNTVEIDLDALDAAEGDNTPGSPNAKLMRAIAPPNASQPDAKWPAPPPNASVNLFIGRALLAHGNDNWPLKPNDIVNWIRKHYPAEWDGDEGRCSAHRVRTYLARKGADMYYEKLNQGCIAGWRIRQNHVWRFENGGFLGRGMKQEEAIAQAHKESEAIATAAHKAAAAEALAAGHPGVKVSMSAPGVYDGAAPPPKRQRKQGTGQARRKNKKDLSEGADTSMTGTQAEGAQSAFYPPPDSNEFQAAFDHNTDLSGSAGQPSSLQIDPTLMSHASGDAPVDMHMVQQAMQAAAAANAGQMDELEMGMQLPIEMQMHGGEGDEGDERYRGNAFGYGGAGEHPYTPHGQEGWQGQIYGHTGYQGRQ